MERMERRQSGGRRSSCCSWNQKYWLATLRSCTGRFLQELRKMPNNVSRLDRDCNGDIPITKQVCQTLHHIRTCVSDVAVGNTAECIRLVTEYIKKLRGRHS